MEGVHNFVSVAEAAVREAGRFLRENLDTRAEATLKGDVDLVTKFDTGAQEILVGRLLAAYPGHGILAEEDLSRTGE
jgi:myo-inositol-1(or 4)-monophosphatase